MQANEYQKFTASTAIYPKDNAISYLMLSLAEETGEVCSILSKAIRDNGGVIDEARKAKLLLECGDVLWMVARLTDELGMPLEEVMKNNVDKLQSRQIRNKINGSGDFR